MKDKEELFMKHTKIKIYREINYKDRFPEALHSRTYSE